MSYFDEAYDSVLPHRAVTVYMYLRDRADRRGECFPAIGTIAKDLSLSRSTVKRAIKDLKAAGWLTTRQRWRDDGKRSSLLYHLRL